MTGAGTPVTAGRHQTRRDLSAAPVSDQRLRRLAVMASGVVAVGLLPAGCVWPAQVSTPPLSKPTATSSTASSTSMGRVSVPGYDRDCGRGGGCSFGPAWSDDVDVEDGHNGCDARSDRMRRDLRDVKLKPGTRGCVPLTGTLHDPYTGVTITYTRGERPARVNVDHVVALAAGWDLGAATWTLERRRNFANDPRNLLTVSAAANLSKGDKTPAEWMPPTQAGRCSYAARYLEVAQAYDITMPTTDQQALDTARRGCP
ncbi:MAG: HNH endonuclease family protein [Dermatophilaceae bacterium]